MWILKSYENLEPSLRLSLPSSYFSYLRSPDLYNSLLHMRSQFVMSPPPTPRLVPTAHVGSEFPFNDPLAEIDSEAMWNAHIYPSNPTEVPNDSLSTVQGSKRNNRSLRRTGCYIDLGPLLQRRDDKLAPYDCCAYSESDDFETLPDEPKHNTKPNNRARNDRIAGHEPHERSRSASPRARGRPYERPDIEIKHRSTQRLVSEFFLDRCCVELMEACRY
jgi:hypothetical protein